MKPKNTICLWFDKDALATPLLFRSEITGVHKAPGDYPSGNGGAESECGWCKDRWGLSWQITPRALTVALAADGDEAKRAFDAMMTMRKIDVAAIEAARRG